MDANLEKDVDRLGRASRRAAAITVLGVVGVGLAMVYASWQLRELERKVDESSQRLVTLGVAAAKAKAEVTTLEQRVVEARSEKQRYQEQILGLTKQVQELQEQLKLTTNLSQFKHPVDWVDVKFVASKYLAQSRLLERILQLRERNVTWNLAGRTPNEGFNSPTFAAYVLSSLRLLDSNRESEKQDLLAASQWLRSSLQQVTKPEVGDVVFYPAGYALFYFLDQQNRPFVIGMTPSGIVALDPKFAEATAVARPDYRRLR